MLYPRKLSSAKLRHYRRQLCSLMGIRLRFLTLVQTFWALEALCPHLTFKSLCPWQLWNKRSYHQLDLYQRLVWSQSVARTWGLSVGDITAMVVLTSYKAEGLSRGDFYCFWIYSTCLSCLSLLNRSLALSISQQVLLFWMERTVWTIMRHALCSFHR